MAKFRRRALEWAAGRAAMSEMVTLEIEDGLATMRMSRAHGNAINGDLVDALTGAAEEAESNPEIRGVLLASEGKLFCPDSHMFVAKLPIIRIGLFFT